MPPDERYAALAATAAQVMNAMPPRENPRVNKSLDSVHASGPLGRAHCVIHGNSNYKQTGLLQAYAAYSLLQQPPQAGRLRLRLPGVRAPRAARRAAQLRAGPRAGRHRRGAEPCGWSTTWTRARRSDAGAPCLTTDGASRSLRRGAGAQPPHRGGAGRPGRAAGRHGRDPVRRTTRSAFTCVFGISRAGAVWCPINPRNEAAENRELLDLFDCAALIFQAPFAPLVEQIRADLPRLHHAGLPRRRSSTARWRWDDVPRPTGTRGRRRAGPSTTSR